MNAVKTLFFTVTFAQILSSRLLKDQYILLKIMTKAFEQGASGQLWKVTLSEYLQETVSRSRGM